MFFRIFLVFLELKKKIFFFNFWKINLEKRNQLKQNNSNQMAIERETDQTANNKRARACINGKRFYKQIQKTFKRV